MWNAVLMILSPQDVGQIASHVLYTKYGGISTYFVDRVADAEFHLFSLNPLVFPGRMFYSV